MGEVAHGSEIPVWHRTQIMRMTNWSDQKSPALIPSGSKVFRQYFTTR